MEQARMKKIETGHPIAKARRFDQSDNIVLHVILAT